MLTPTILVKLKTLYESKYLGEITEEMERVLNDENVSKTTEVIHLGKFKDKFDNYDTFRRRIINFAKVSVISGIFTIFFSIIVLAKVNWLINSNYTCCTYMLGFLGLAVSILTMSYIIIESLGEKSFQGN